MLGETEDLGRAGEALKKEPTTSASEEGDVEEAESSPARLLSVLKLSRVALGRRPQSV
jgi:hypothetical protein